MPHHTVATRDEDGAVVVELGGEIDVAASNDVRQALYDAVDRAASIVVDLGPCTFLDSTGLGLLVGAHKRLVTAAKPPLVVRNPSDIVRQALTVTGLDQILTLE